MFQPILAMANLPDPRHWLRQWAARQRARDTVLHNLRKPRMTPEEARRDHWQMLRLMGFHALAGAFIGLVVAAALILLNIGGLWQLISRASDPVLPVLLVAVPFVSLFAAAAAAGAILTLPYDRKFREDDDDPETGQ